MQRHLMSPLTFNAVCWAFPLLQLGSIVAPAVLADTKYNSQLRNYHAWLGSAMAASPNPDAETFMNLADEGHAIWLEVTRAYWLYAVCMTGESTASRLLLRSGIKID